MSVSFIIWVAVGWCLGVARIPQRFIPVNPITAEIKKKVREFEAQLVRDLLAPADPAPAPVSPPPPPAKA